MIRQANDSQEEYMRKSSRILSVIAICAAAMLLVPAVLQAGTTKELKESYRVSPGGELVVETDLGSIEVRAGTGNEVNVEVRLEADTHKEKRAQEIFDDFTVDFEQQGNDVYVTAQYDRSDNSWRFWEDRRNQLKVAFLIEVPKEYNATVKTAGGSISVDDLKGAVRVKTSGGSLSFGHIDGPIEGNTSGGSINLAECTGSIDVTTSGGSIEIGRVEGDVVAHTSGGSISVDEVFGTIDASTSGGSVTVHISQQPKADCRLETSGGSVTVYMPSDISIDLDAKTSSGRIHNDFPVRLSGRISKSSVQAEINDGGPQLYLRTSGGNIYLSEL